MQRKSKNNAMGDESTLIALLISIFAPCTRRLAKMQFRCAAGRLDGTYYPRCGLKRENMALWASIGAHRERPHRSPVCIIYTAPAGPWYRAFRSEAARAQCAKLCVITMPTTRPIKTHRRVSPRRRMGQSFLPTSTAAVRLNYYKPGAQLLTERLRTKNCSQVPSCNYPSASHRASPSSLRPKDPTKLRFLVNAPFCYDQPQ
jgi:hypothetical protein